jgi:hypothetical protein
MSIGTVAAVTRNILAATVAATLAACTIGPD